MTHRGAEKLKKEYSELFQVERPKIVETVAWAASNGDRSENADYHYGKKRLREIDRRLKYISDRLEIAEVIDTTQIKSETIVFGATVVLIDDLGKEQTYQIVGEDEYDISKGHISWKSPLGRALLGKKQGEEVCVLAPGGEKYYTVRKIEYI